MARDFIKIDTTTTIASGASQLKTYISSLRQAIENGARVKAVMDHNQDGTDFTDIEALFGLPTGHGKAVYDMVNGAAGSMDGLFQTADARKLTEMVG